MADTSKYGSPFVETEMVLAAEVEDWKEVDRILGTMTRLERVGYLKVIGSLHLAVDNYIDNND
jgi:hypothetical protein